MAVRLTPEGPSLGPFTLSMLMLASMLLDQFRKELNFDASIDDDADA